MMRLYTCVYFLVCATTAEARTVWSHASNYSLWMATSIIARNQSLMANTTDVSELLQAGLTQKAFSRVMKQWPEAEAASDIAAYIDRSINSAAPFLNNASHDLIYPLDRLSNDNGAIQEYRATNNKSYLSTAEALYQSVELQPRNPAGGLWYFTYPEWSYLDGMFSFAPFYIAYARALLSGTIATAAYDDVELQLELLWQHCQNNATGLLVHGYDYSKTAVWANPVSGGSPHVWGRSLGWYMVALVDTLELSPHISSLAVKLQQLGPALVNTRDRHTGAWWQILDEPGRTDNYIESSSSAMFVYVLLKGHRLGYLPDYTAIAMQAYEYIIRHFVVHNSDGTLGYNGTVSVCSLNSTASYEYYVGQPILYNSVLGSGSFILASLEVEMRWHKHRAPTYGQW